MDLARYIDHTLLKPDCTSKDIATLCEQAKQYEFAAVCLPPYYVREASHQLEDGKTKLSTVIGFPMGYASIPSKVEEIKRAIDEGAHELDAVMNICAIRNGQWNFVRNEVESLTTACHMRGRIIKLIFETGLLRQAEITRLCEIVTEVKVDFVKTSTGYNGPGANPDVVRFLRKSLPDSIRIKASGGIRTAEQVSELIAAGANRIGTSVGLALIDA
ncbi:MAG: hypothetical protein RLY31_1042 [Bacteroidota bacterium]